MLSAQIYKIMPKTSIEEIKTLKKYLRRGDIKALAAELGVTRVAIFYAMTGETQKCDYILNAVVALAEKRMGEQGRVTARLKKL